VRDGNQEKDNALGEQTCMNLNLWCIIYPKWIDRELAQLMGRADCREVSLGFESGSDRILGGFNKRFRSEEVRAASGIFTEAGIQRRGFLLLGGPGETRESVEESLEFADSLKLDALKIRRAADLPGDAASLYRAGGRTDRAGRRFAAAAFLPRAGLGGMAP